MSRIALSPNLPRGQEAAEVIVEFRLGLHPSDEMVAACAADDVPAFLRRAPGSPFSRAPWTCGDGKPGLGGSILRPYEIDTPMAGYASPYLLSAVQRRELEAWLDRVLPGWEAQRDGYGNPRVLVVDAAPQHMLDKADRDLDEAWASGPGRPA